MANWSDEENDRIVEDYFAMLAKEIAGEPYSKADHRKTLTPKLNNRLRGSIEYKHQNISAVLEILGKNYISGYKPARNFQTTLADAVARRLTHQPDQFDQTQYTFKNHDAGLLSVGPPPTLSNRPPPRELNKMRYVARKFDVAGRDKRNRILGEAGEEFVYEYERISLKNANRNDLAKKVRWVSKEDGDGAGYDIASFEPNGHSRLIEVKTTNGLERTPFYITKNEKDVAEIRSKEWCLFRLWNFSQEPKAFELRHPLTNHVSLIATTYRAAFFDK